MHHGNKLLNMEFAIKVTQRISRSIASFPSFKSWETDDVIAVFVVIIILALWCKNTLLSKPEKGYHLYFTSPQREDGIDKHNFTTKKVASRNINDRMDELKKDIIVFWGSQSGKSERLANEFVRECSSRFGLAAMIGDIDMFDMHQISTLTKGRFVGFVVATYGEGDPTDNAFGLYEYLKEIHGSTAQPLSQLQYFCFGLGSSQYQSYNRFVDFVDVALSSAGATRIAPVGKMDEALHSNDSWLSWKGSVMKDLAVKFGKKEQMDISQSLGPTLTLLESPRKKSHDRAESHAAEELSMRTRVNPNPQIVQLTNIHQLSSRSKASTREYLNVELNIKTRGGALKYKTGDHLAIWPINPDHEVDLLAEMFQWDKNTLGNVVNFKVNNGIDDSDTMIPVKTPTTRDAILRYQLDICGPLFPEIVRLLIMYCPTMDGRSYLKNTIQNQENWQGVIQAHLTCAQLMRLAAPSERWPEDLFCAFIPIMPKIRPRYFSIASSPLLDPESIALTVGVVETRLPQNKGTFFGLTTGYIRALCEEFEVDDIHKARSSETCPVSSPKYNLTGPRSILAGQKVFAHVRPSVFSPPKQLELPIIMFASGSGIAPFRAFVQERLILKKKGMEIGPMTLFIGCRSKDDLLYADLWEEAASLGALETHIAFSTHLIHGKKIYVQDLLLQSDKKCITDAILERGGITYICGSSNMARGVKVALDSLLGGKDLVANLKRSKRLHEDVWVS